MAIIKNSLAAIVACILLLYTLKCAYLIQNQYRYTTITIVFEGDMLEDVCAVIWNIFSLWFLWPYLLPTFRSKLELNEARLLILFIVTKAYKVRAWLSRALCLGKIHFVTFPKQSKNQYYKLIADFTALVDKIYWLKNIVDFLKNCKIVKILGSTLICFIFFLDFHDIFQVC